jgi:hypothetical protein
MRRLENPPVPDSDPLRRAALRLAADERSQFSEDLPMLAIEALIRGLDSPALREVAAMSRVDDDTRDRFVQALGELGIEILDQQSALWALVREKAADIVSGRVSPYEGASWIWGASDQVKREGDLRIFVGLASEWDDHSDYRSVYDTQIIEAARGLLARVELRRWVKIQACSGRWPLWERDRNLAHDELPLTDELRHDLATWAADFDSAQRRGGPGPSKFPAQTDAEAFVARGSAMAARLQTELGDAWHVEYTPTPSAFPAR